MNKTDHLTNICKHGNLYMNKPDIDRLLTNESSDQSIIEMENYISHYCSNGGQLDRLTEPQKNFFFILQLMRQVHEGGFNYYFYEVSGRFAHETLQALKAVGAESTADLLDFIISYFPGRQVLKDDDERRGQLEIMDKTDMLEIMDRDHSLYGFPDSFIELLLEYVRQNRDYF